MDYPTKTATRSLTDELTGAAQERKSLALNTWRDLALEGDRTLLNLSMGAVGLLVGLVAPSGLAAQEVGLFGGAIGAFCAAIGALLVVHHLNKKIMLHLYHEEVDQAKQVGATSNRWEAVSKVALFVGVLLAIILAVNLGRRIGKEKALGNDPRSDAGCPDDGFVQKGLGDAHLLWQQKNPPPPPPPSEPKAPPPPKE